MRINDFLPKADQRLTIVGASGSGKTTLAKALLAAHKGAVLVIDPKGTFGGKRGPPGYDIIRNPKGLHRVRRGMTHILYRPGPDAVALGAYDLAYRWAYERTNILVYTDEVFSTMRGTRSPDWQRAVITCGRELGVGMINSTQRPKGIDPRILSEAEAIAAFRTRKLADSKFLSEFMGEEVLKAPPRFAFWYWREEVVDPPILARIDLTKREG